MPGPDSVSIAGEEYPGCGQGQDVQQYRPSHDLHHVDILPLPVYNRTATASNKGAAMKTIVIYSSKHHMNTEKVAQAIAGELKAEARKVSDVKP